MGVTYIPVAQPGEVAEGDMKPVDLGGREVLLANVGGEYFAFSRQCPHEGTELDSGELNGTRLRCEGHSYCFDLRTGECVLPAGGPTLAVLPVEQREGQLCVKLEW